MIETEDELVAKLSKHAELFHDVPDHVTLCEERVDYWLGSFINGQYLAREAATRIASLTARVIELEGALATGRLNSSARRATDPALGWDGIGEIFDPNCHCEKCAIGRAQQRERNDARSLIPKP